MEIKVSARYERVYVHLDGVLHLTFDRSKFIGMQSWVNQDKQQYCIEYTLDGGVIVCDYDTSAKWTGILQQMEEILYWGKTEKHSHTTTAP